MPSTSNSSQPSYRQYGFGAAHSVTNSQPGHHNGVQRQTKQTTGGYVGSAGNKHSAHIAEGLHHRGNRPADPSSNDSSGGSQAYMKLKLSQLQRQLANVEFSINEIAEGNGDCSNQRKSEISQEINALLRDIEDLQRSFNGIFAGTTAEESRRTLVPMKTYDVSYI